MRIVLLRARASKMLFSGFIVLFVLGCGATAAVEQRQNDGETPTGKVDPSTISDCTWWLNTVGGETCASVADYYGLPVADFIKYNPSLKADCSGLTTGYSYCIEENHGLGPLPTTSTTTSKASTTTTTTTTGNGISTPTPTQPGMASNCDAFYLVKSGDECGAIASKNGITLAQFYAWNTGVGSSCQFLWLDTYYCVSIVGVNPSPTSTSKVTTTTSKATTTTGKGITTPTPTQSGLASNCDAFYLVKSGDECGAIASKNGITLAQFYAWNTGVGSSCQFLWLDTYYCVSIIGVSPSFTTSKTTTTTSKTTSNGIATPTPTQPGMTANCKKFHLVKSGDQCGTIATKYGITLAQFYAWNTGVGSNCQFLWLDTYYCVGI